jgi:hypothetical protein
MKHKDLKIVHKYGQPYGIRDSHGYLFFFPEIHMYQGQENRYRQEITDHQEMAADLLKALENRK